VKQKVEIILPELGTSRVIFSLWYVQPGDRVFEGDRVAEVSIPGATFAVPAPITGILIEKHSLPNDPLSAGQILGLMEEDS
jgi:pyruvate/2-oxoglutarate dehydrogenase complex dihydrolipoamide acyltransferase (E2) component